MKEDTLFLNQLCALRVDIKQMTANWSVYITIHICWQLAQQVIYELIHCDNNLLFETIVNKHTRYLCTIPVIIDRHASFPYVPFIRSITCITTLQFN